MTNQPRLAKVLASLIASMTIGALVLLALEDRPIPAGAFSLASYSHLDSIEQIITNQTDCNKSRWNRIEIFYSKTAGGNIKQLAALKGLAGEDDVNFHFVVCNGKGGRDGQIQASKRWHRQWSALPGKSWYGSSHTIRICLIANGTNVPATGCQIKRTNALVEALARRFQIGPGHIYYPDDWQL